MCSQSWMQEVDGARRRRTWSHCSPFVQSWTQGCESESADTRLELKAGRIWRCSITAKCSEMGVSRAQPAFAIYRNRMSILGPFESSRWPEQASPVWSLPHTSQRRTLAYHTRPVLGAVLQKALHSSRPCCFSPRDCKCDVSCDCVA